MKLFLMLFVLILNSCGGQDANQIEIINENPKKEEEIQEVTYPDVIPDIFAVTEFSLSNHDVLTLEIGATRNYPIRIKANNKIDELKSISSNNTDLVFSKSCVKPYSIDEECILNLPITSDMSGKYIFRFVSNSNVRFFILTINRVPVDTSLVLSGNSSLSFVNVSFGVPVSQNMIITNQGDIDSESLSFSFRGLDTDVYSIGEDSCSGRILKKGSSCQISLSFFTNVKNNGSYFSELIAHSGLKNLKISNLSGNVVNSTINNQAPVVLSSVILAKEGRNINYQLEVADIENDQLFYEINDNSGATISSSGVISYVPNSLENQSIIVTVTDKKNPIVTKVLKLNLIKELNYSGNTVFNEGEVKNLLMSFTITANPNKIVNSIETNLKDFVTATRFSGSGVTGLTHPLMNQNSNQLPKRTGGNNVFVYDVGGSVKYAGAYQLQVRVKYSDLTEDVFEKSITVNSENLPYLRYDLFAVKGNGTITGYSAVDIYDMTLEMKREFAGWRTPILTNIRHEEINCNGTIIDDLDYENDNHYNCTKARQSDNSETAFISRDVYSGDDVIGGVSLGLRQSMYVRKNNWIHTLAHEMGHQLGLWHTYESYWNDWLAHCTSNDLNSCGIFRLVENISGRSGVVVGDWSNWISDNSQSNGASAFSFNSQNDTDIDYYNSRVVSSLNLNSSARSALLLYYGRNSNPGGYQNGDSVVIGQQDIFLYGNNSTDNACIQYGCPSGYGCNNLSEVSQYNPTYSYPVFCYNIPGKPSVFELPESVVKNTMSYWIHDDNSARFSPNQKSRMDEVLNVFTELVSDE